jgi:hypothetical protein
MPSRRRRPIKQYTPPPDLAYSGEGHIDTPARTAIIVCRLLEPLIDTPIPCDIVEQVSGVCARSQGQTLESHSPRKLHNRPDHGPDPRGRKRGLTRDDTTAIANYLDDDKHVSLEDRGAPWDDIALEAGCDLPEVNWNSKHKPLGQESIQRACKADHGIINAVCEEERELSSKQAIQRLEWKDDVQEERPEPEDWKDTCFCDEFHLGLGPTVTKRI